MRHFISRTFDPSASCNIDTVRYTVILINFLFYTLNITGKRIAMIILNFIYTLNRTGKLYKQL